MSCLDNPGCVFHIVAGPIIRGTHSETGLTYPQDILRCAKKWKLIHTNPQDPEVELKKIIKLLNCQFFVGCKSIYMLNLLLPFRTSQHHFLSFLSFFLSIHVYWNFNDLRRSPPTYGIGDPSIHPLASLRPPPQRIGASQAKNHWKTPVDSMKVKGSWVPTRKTWWSFGILFAHWKTGLLKGMPQ